MRRLTTLRNFFELRDNYFTELKSLSARLKDSGVINHALDKLRKSRGDARVFCFGLCYLGNGFLESLKFAKENIDYYSIRDYLLRGNKC